MVVNLTGYTLFVTSQYDIILTFGDGLAKFVGTACMANYSTCTLLTRYCRLRCVTNKRKLISAPI